MSLFVIDQEKCKHDGICAAECPVKLIEMKDKESVPTPVTNAEEFCINCGHCVAVCPHEAFSLKTMTPEQCRPVKKDLLLNQEQVEQFLCSRRSVRVYKDKPVEREIITKLIDIAKYAPSGHNSQPVEWLVVYDSSEVRRMTGLVVDWMRHTIKEQPDFAAALRMDRIVDFWESGIDSICRKAPHLIVVHGAKENVAAPPAANIAVSHLELAIHSFGLGGCWAGYFNAAAIFWPPLKKALEHPEGHVSLGAMMIGHPIYKYHRIPLRNDAKVTWK
ncbi:MAG: 4Fe-4S dicluster domain-containing protein [Desulfobacteraceae bacterium]|nr:4Fe-4S dicluster domain-containing protein [Desulfobacteraceae bacterium]MCP4348192.1 4Fe-4S dicluster domain-containing protein [Desulfobacterales bacterium]